MTNCHVIRHRGTFLVILDELKLTPSNICVTFKCSVKAVNHIILALVSYITTFSSFRIIYPLRVHFQENGSSLLFPHDEGGGVFHRDSLLGSINSSSRRNPGSLSNRAAARKDLRLLSAWTGSGS